jgi:LysM repeat protein
MNRSTLSLIILLVVLGIAAYFLLPSEKERQTSYKPAEINLSIDSVSVVKVEIHRPGKTVTLENLGGKWTVTSPVNYPAEDDAVKRIISEVKQFKVGSLISSNVEKQSMFQVDTTGTQISLTERGGNTVSLIIGKTGPSYSEVYFRLPGSKDVYLGEGIEPWTINKELKDWRDKVIFASPSEMIKDLTYNSGGKEYHFHHDTSGWKSEDKPVNANTMNPLLNSLANLRADDFVDSTARTTGRVVKLSIQGSQDIDLTFSPSPPDSSKYFVRTSKSAQTYLVSKWVAQQLMKPIEEPAPAKHVPAVASTPPKEVKEVPPPVHIAEKQPEKKPEKKPAPPVTAPPKTVVTKTPKSDQNAKKVTESQPTASVPPPVKEAVKKEAPAKAPPKTPEQTQQKTQSQVKPKTQSQAQQQPPAKPPASIAPPTMKSPTSAQPATTTSSTEDDGDLTVHTVKRGETMQTIAKQYGVTVEQILKWNLLKTISIKPGQELYVFVKNSPKK